MTDLDKIPADITMPMTEPLQRAFRAEACDPACHVCEKLIPVGDDFELVSINHPFLYTGGTQRDYWTDEMTCGKHGRKDLERMAKVLTDEQQKILDMPPYKGFSRPSIVQAMR